MNSDQILREQLLRLLQGGNAHMDIDQAVADFPLDSMNLRPPNVPYTPWHLLEHIRITQSDILEFVRDPRHESPQWPKGYWPDPDANADEAQWKATIKGIRDDLRDLGAIVQDPATDFFGPIPHAKDYNILREVLLTADHNAYHIGEFGILRQVMGTWPKK
jgi:hypothetical protein